jgi:hypothetical protein
MELCFVFKGTRSNLATKLVSFFLWWWVVMSFLQDYLHEAPYTTEEIEEILQENLRTVMAKSPSSLAVLSAASNFKLFQVNSCFMSIITEDS